MRTLASAARVTLVAAALATAALASGAASAAAAPLPVLVQFQAFSPNLFDALPGDTVTWTNHSGRRHTVTADQGEFDSGSLFDGQQFSRTFTAIGIYSYHCTVHPGMLGEVDVRRVTLSALPSSPVLPGAIVSLDGRTAAPGMAVRVEEDTGAGFQTVTTAAPRADGTWSAQVRPAKTAQIRAAVGPDLSETRQILVTNRTVRVRVARGHLFVTVTPAAPYARIALQFRLRERFGWWAVSERRLDYVSEATFRVRGQGRVRARVVLLGRDGWTALALSPVVRVLRG